MSNIAWRCVNASGPAVAHHTAVAIGGALYIHGGVQQAGSTSPTNHLHRFDLQTRIWTDLTSAQSPALSHHASVVRERYMILIGGWTGKMRSSDVHVYDTETNSWQATKTHGFPAGAGLSSHSALALKNGDVLVIGREGSLRTQRRSGNSFLLKCNLSKGNFEYSAYPVSVASRSGHSSSGCCGRVIVIGGRNDRPVEQHGGFTALEAPCDIVGRLAQSRNAMISTNFPSRKHHVAVSGGGCVFIHGGETFDGRNRKPVGEMYLFVLKPTATFRNLGLSEVCRAGHVACSGPDWLIIHGGINEKQSVANNVYELIMS